MLICVYGNGSKKEYSTLISNSIVDLNMLEAGAQCFPRYYYEKIDTPTISLFDLPDNDYYGYTRYDCITDYVLNECHKKYGTKLRQIDKDLIFYYVYGLLHSQEYKQAFSSDLKKMLPRIPLVDKASEFDCFSRAGKELADLHLKYEQVEPYPNVKIIGEDKCNFTVTKMRFGKDYDKNDDKSIIHYNDYIMISYIPLMVYDYVINGKSAVEWIMDRYQDKTDNNTLIRNNPNDWLIEHENPRYILDLLLSIITLSLKTLQIVTDLPKLEF
jgi:predicted helicase